MAAISKQTGKTAFLALILALLSFGLAQVAKRRPADKGPRALGLLQIAQNGKAHLVPIAIMIDGRFYDASAYKADPVPMALQSDVVYEADKTGVPQGIFTVSGALPTRQGWIGDGKWQTQAQIDADKARSKADAARREQTVPIDQDSGPPKLKRPGNQGQVPSAVPGTSAPDSTSTGSAPVSDDSHPRLTKRSEDQQSSATSSSIDDSNRPMLRRQAPSQTTHEQTKAGEEAEPLTGPLELIPAISDAGGPDPRPYSYQMKPDEEQGLMKKMQSMAADEIRARAAHLAEGSAPASSPAKKAAVRKSPQKANSPAVECQNPQLRVFDLSNTNEPVLVFTAEAKLPANDLDFMVALVAREDIYGDLHKVYAQTTDDKHLDVTARYELIDAVDANGDGVGELLFRQTWDSGTAYAVYSVIGDQLWPLFEGKPGT